MNKKNILILSCGTRNKVVQAFKQLDSVGMLICADSSIYAPALYEGDIQEIIPRITDPDYLPTLFAICQKWNIKGLVSLIDPELELIAEHVEDFREIGCEPMISSVAAIKNCFDKNKFSEILNQYDFPTIPSTSSITMAKTLIESGKLKFPLMIKPAKGSASVGLNKVTKFSELDQFVDFADELIIQEWMELQEYGIDCYVDMHSGNLVEMFIKKKLKMRAGETDKAISQHHELIRDTINNFLNKYPYQFFGTIDIDVFCDNSNCYISEINPRFGGGYPHAQAAGLNYPEMYLNNLKNKTNPNFTKFKYKAGIVMMKYNEIMIKNIDNL